MTNESIRQYCLSLPHTTEVVRWVDHLLFKVGGKMFAIIELDGHSCTLKCTPEGYAELVEQADIVPASHNMWKHQWITTETLDALPDREFRERLNESYSIVRSSLPRKVQAQLDGAAPSDGPAPERKRRAVPAAPGRPSSSSASKR